MEHGLISTQQHQYHPSHDGARKNYGGVLAVWDWLFDSLRVSRPGERFELSIAGEDGHHFKVMDDEEEPFTNFEYHNIGTPTNLDLRRVNGIAEDFQDTGLAGRSPDGDSDRLGMFRVPTLRNIAVTRPYMHNGVFRDFRTVI